MCNEVGFVIFPLLGLNQFHAYPPSGIRIIRGIIVPSLGN